MKTKEGLWKLSPSKLYGYDECPRCFWIEQRIGAHPSPPFTLNNAMDSKLKTRYDGFRKKKEVPPEISSLKGIRLFPDLDILNQWRSKLTTLEYVNEKAGYVLSGKLDEVFVNSRGELLPADFKSSGDAPKEDKYKYYVSQLHAYALMISKRNHKVAGFGYLVHYFVENKQNPKLEMRFKTHIDKVELNLPAFEKKLKKIVEVLNDPLPKDYSESCRKCPWRSGFNDLLVIS